MRSRMRSEEKRADPELSAEPAARPVDATIEDLERRIAELERQLGSGGGDESKLLAPAALHEIVNLLPSAAARCARGDHAGAVEVIHCCGWLAAAVMRLEIGKSMPLGTADVVAALKLALRICGMSERVEIEPNPGALRARVNSEVLVPVLVVVLRRLAAVPSLKGRMLVERSTWNVHDGALAAGPPGSPAACIRIRFERAQAGPGFAGALQELRDRLIRAVGGSVHSGDSIQFALPADVPRGT